MKYLGLKFILVFTILNCIFSSVFSQIPQILNPSSDIIPYCNDSVLVAPQVTIQDIKIKDINEGMKVSLVNYVKGDILVYDEVAGLRYFFDDEYGSLYIRGIGSDSLYQEAIRKVYYKNVANIPIADVRVFTISLIDADYLPYTQHFYRFIDKPDVTWANAKEEASKMTYYGLQGYLVTITSAAENDFIWKKINGVGWIGASDQEIEGKWKWMTGPEAGTLFWDGGIGGSPVNGEFSFWNQGEPNNVIKQSGYDEDYAHINSNPNTLPKSWNDLPNAGDGPNSQYYRAMGYIVEFGGFEGEPEILLHAIAEIRVNKIAFSDNHEFEICKHETQELNLKDYANAYTYTWTPNLYIDDTTASNPVVNPPTSTLYKAIGKRNDCIDSVEFTVQVNPIPIHSWEKDNIICKGDSIKLDPGEHTSYLWNNLDTTRSLTVLDEGNYIVKLTNEFECTTKDTAAVTWSIIPKLDYSKLDTLVCGSKQQRLTFSFENGTANTKLSSLKVGVQIEDETTLNPIVTVNDYGVYYFQMEIKNQDSCSFIDTLKLEFHNQPTAKFELDEQECAGYNLKLSYEGETFEDALFDWYSNDTIYRSGTNINSLEIPLGVGLINRSVGLQINEQGCIDSFRILVTVTPTVNFWPEESEGCTPLNVNFNYTASEEIDDFYWEFGDGENSSDKKPIHIYKNPELVDLQMDVILTIVSKEGCKNIGILKDTVKIHPIPTIDFDFDENKCNNENGTVWYSGSGNNKDNYLWDLSDFQSDEIVLNPENSSGPLEFNRISKPTVTIGLKMISQFSCESDSIFKVWKRKPIYEVSLDNDEGCSPLKIEFSALAKDNVDDINYTWDFGDGSSGAGDKISNIYFGDSTTYSINVVANSTVTNCQDTFFLSKEVFTFPSPVADFDANPPNVLISNPRIYFENKSIKSSSYEWNFGDKSAFSTDANPDHFYNDMGFYNVSLFAINDYACEDTSIQQVSVAFDKVYPPTVFSPNAGLTEDREFRIYAEGIVNAGYHLSVFNRWGELIFESPRQEFGWDGRMKNGKFAPSGVYIWIIQYNDFMGKKHDQQGTVTLLF